MLSTKIIDEIDEITCEQSLEISLHLMECYCKELSMYKYTGNPSYIMETDMSTNTTTSSSASTSTHTTVANTTGSQQNTQDNTNHGTQQSVQNNSNPNVIKNKLTNAKNVMLKVTENISKFVKNFIERIKNMFSKERATTVVTIDNKSTNLTTEQKAKILETIDQAETAVTFQSLKNLLIELQNLMKSTAEKAHLPLMHGTKPKDIVRSYLNEHKLPVMYSIEEIAKNINNAYAVFNAIDAYAKELNKSLMQKKMQQKVASTFHKNAKFYDEFRTKMGAFSKTMTGKDMGSTPIGYQWTFVDPKQYLERFNSYTQLLEKLIELGESIAKSFNDIKTGIGYATSVAQRNTDNVIAKAKQQDVNGNSGMNHELSAQTSEQLQDMKNIQTCANCIQTTVMVLRNIMLAKKLTEDLIYGMDKIISITINGITGNQPQ